MKIPLVDLVAQYHSIQHEIDAAVHNVLEGGSFILGPNVVSLEQEIADYLGVKYAVGVASGTDALVLSLRAFGIGPGDEVVVPVNTFFATAEAVSQVGATPVFADIDPRTYCIAVEQLEARVTPRTKAIIPVHLYGHPAEMDTILELAQERGLKVIEDNAQAIGAEYNGRKTGSLGDAGCLSFFPSKNLGGYGDGGMITTDNPQVADAVRKLRTHGWNRKYYPEMLGFNSRLDELQAAILRVKLRHLDAWNERRRAISKRYRDLLADVRVETPQEASYAKHVYHLFVLRVAQRDTVREQLHLAGIGTGIYYPQPLHLLQIYECLGYRPGAFPESEQAAQQALAIPLYPEMADRQINEVATTLKKSLALVDLQFDESSKRSAYALDE